MTEFPTEPPEESNSRRVLRGFAAMSASSFGVMAVQLGYTAITSRLLPPSAFGAYAVALSGVGLIGMLGGSSLGQSAARRDHDSVHLDRSLVALALLVGSTTALVAISLAPLWGRLWGVPESTQVTWVLALGIPLSAVSAVLGGILRRGGRTSAVAGRTGIGQLSGMAVGLAAILVLGTPWSLGVSSVAGLVVTAMLLSAALPRDRIKPAKPSRALSADALYGGKAAGMNILRQGVLTLPAWSVGRFVGAEALGAYNRATTVITLPLATLQRSLNFALFPELRPRGPVSQNPRAFTDLMILLAWPAVLVGGLGYFLAAPVVLIVLGQQWTSVAPLAGWAVLLGVVPAIGTPLGAALEALGQFRLTLYGFVASLPATVGGIVATIRLDSPVPALVGLVIAAAMQASTHLLVAARLGLVDMRAYFAGVRAMLVTQAFVTAALVAISVAISDQVIRLLCMCSVAVLECALLWGFRRKTRFGRIAAARSLPGFQPRRLR